MEHRCLARRPLPLGALLCGTDLATCERRTASLFYHSPHVVQTLPVLSYTSPSACLRGHYSWSTLDLMTHRLEGLIFPSVLLANRTLCFAELPPSRLLPNIVLPFLVNGLTCGEVIRPVQTGEPLLRHWSLRTYAWRHTALTRGWSSKDASIQARVLYDLLKPSDGYHLDCASHDADDSRRDR